MSSFNFCHVIKATRWKQKKRQRKWKLLLGVSKKFRPVWRRGCERRCWRCETPKLLENVQQKREPPALWTTESTSRGVAWRWIDYAPDEGRACHSHKTYVFILTLVYIYCLSLHLHIHPATDRLRSRLSPVFSQLLSLSRSPHPVQTQRLVPLDVGHGQGGPGHGHGVQPSGGLLFGARSPLAAQLHLQVQGDGWRGAAAPLPARVPQRLPAGRSPPQVRGEKVKGWTWKNSLKQGCQTQIYSRANI